MKLFFDTETTGKALMRAPLDHPAQPHIVQLAALLCDEDGREAACVNLIVRPNRWSIPTEASDIHGITTEFAEKAGTPIGYVLDIFGGICQSANEVIAHNLDFDRFMHSLETTRHECTDFLPTKWFCTMKATTPICKLPGQYGDYKWPKLSEAYRHLFNEELVGAHDALADVRACARIYFELIKREKEAANV